MATKGKIYETLLAGLEFDGVTLSGGKVYFCTPGGTSTDLKSIWLDRDKTTLASNPYTLDTDGRAEIFGDGVYDIVVKTAALVTKANWPNVSILDAAGDLVYPVNSGGNLASASTASDAAGKVVFVTSPIVVTTAISWPSDRTLEFGPKGCVTFTGGGSLTGLRYVKVSWFAKSDGVTNDFTAIQSAVNAGADGATIDFSGGRYYLLSDGAGIGVVSRNRLKLHGYGALMICGKNTRSFSVLSSSNIDIAGFTFTGSIQTDLFTGNAEQGHIVTETSSGINIHDNVWSDTASAVFFGHDSSGINVHHNRILNTHAGVQSNSAAYSNITVTDNYFLGHVYPLSIQGSDDQIAFFGAASGDVIISRNIINKQGPTVYNQARAINISVGTGANARIVVTDNIIKNVVSTTPAQARPAIEIGGTSGARTVSNMVVSGNVISNCNLPISVEAFANKIIVTNNNIDTSIVTAGSNPPSGKGIAVNTGGDDANVLISSNMINGSASHGIDVTVAPNINIVNNVIRNSGERGINVDTCQSAIISTNHVKGSTLSGISLNSTANVVVTGNVLDTNGAYGISLGGTITSPKIANNSYVNNTSGMQNSSPIFSTSAPSTGTWYVGDRTANSTPTVGQPKGWVCTVAGTPGTWVSEGNL